MSGPYDCLMCGGCGQVETNVPQPGQADIDGSYSASCPDCNGSGEHWPGPCVFSPSQDDRDAGRVEYVDGGWRFKEGHLPKGYYQGPSGPPLPWGKSS